MADAVGSPVRPRLSDLLADPRRLTRRQLAAALIRPWLAFLAFAVFAHRGWWLAAGVAVAVVFATDVVVIHDLFHRNLGLSQRVNSVLTFVYGTLLLNSGHALALTHLHHHRVYPDASDPEAYVDGWPIWRVVLEGPRYRFRVWGWAWRHRGQAGGAIALAAAIWLTAWAMALVFGHRLPALRAYVVFAELGSWAFPLISVTGVHDRRASGALQQSRTLRAPLSGRVMLGMQFHLEHHLYPRVPAARLPELAAALDPWLALHGAAVWGRASTNRRIDNEAGRPTRGALT